MGRKVKVCTGMNKGIEVNLDDRGRFRRRKICCMRLFLTASGTWKDLTKKLLILYDDCLVHVLYLWMPYLGCVNQKDVACSMRSEECELESRQVHVVWFP